jgi:hypothetical protein
VWSIESGASSRGTGGYLEGVAVEEGRPVLERVDERDRSVGVVMAEVGWPAQTKQVSKETQFRGKRDLLPADF